MRSFSDDNHTLIFGDALEALHQIPDGTVNLVFADPPYNIGKRFGSFVDRWESAEAYAAWAEAWLALCLAKLSPDGSLYVMTSTQAMPYFDLFLRRRATILSRIIWHYDSSGVQARQYFGSLYEPILHVVLDPRRYTFNDQDVQVEARTGATRKLIDYRKPVPTEYASTKVPGNVWYFPRVRYRMDEYEEHPSQKPEALLQRIILASSKPDDLVLDPFAGTFTTAAVARRLGRRSISIERERDYVGIGLRRLGLATELDGAPLAPPEKSFRRRRGSDKEVGSGQLLLGTTSEEVA